MLPISRDYFNCERPDEMALLRLTKNAFMFDGQVDNAATGVFLGSIKCLVETFVWSKCILLPC